MSNAAVDAHRADFPIEGFSHVEFWVGNAYQSAQFFRSVMGYSIVGYRGPETGTPDRVSYALEQGNVRMLFTAALHSAMRSLAIS